MDNAFTKIIHVILQGTYAVRLAATESHLNFVNSLNCEVKLTFSPELTPMDIPTLENVLLKQINAGNYTASVKSCRGDGEFPIQAIGGQVVYFLESFGNIVDSFK